MNDCTAALPKLVPSFPITILPLESVRSLSLPAVSTVNVSAEGNLITVFVSPV